MAPALVAALMFLWPLSYAADHSPAERVAAFRAAFPAEHARHWVGRGRLVDELWREGITTFFASLAVPEATEDDLGLNDPPGLIHACKQRRNELLHDMLANLESTDPAVIAAYFTKDGGRHPWIPRRAGAFMGLLMAQSASALVDYRDMAHLGTDEAAEVTEKALRDLLAESDGRPAAR